MKCIFPWTALTISRTGIFGKWKIPMFSYHHIFISWKLWFGLSFPPKDSLGHFFQQQLLCSALSGQFLAVYNALKDRGNTVVNARRYLSTSNGWSLSFPQRTFRWSCYHPELLQGCGKRHGWPLYSPYLLPMSLLCWVYETRKTMFTDKIRRLLITDNVHLCCMWDLSGCNVSAGFWEFYSGTVPCCCCKWRIYWRYRYLILKTSSQYAHAIIFSFLT